MGMRPVTVITTSTQIAGVNLRRRVLVFRNNGAATIFVSQDQANITTDGFPVLVNQSATLLATDGDEPWLPLYGQVAAGSENGRVVEQFGLLDPASEAALAELFAAVR